MDPILKQPRLHQGHGRRADAGAGQGPALQIRRGRQGPRRDHGLHRGAHRRSSAAKLPQAFNTLVKGNLEVRRLPPEEEPGAPGAYGGAGSIDGTIPGKFWINLRTTELHTQVRPARPRPSRGDPRPRLAGRICQQAAADPHPARVQRLFRRLGALRRAARRRARRLRRHSRPDGSATSRASRSAPAAWWSTPASTPSAGAASRPSTSSSTRTAPTAEEVRERSRPLLQLAGPGLRLQGRPQRDQPPARPARKAALGARLRLQGVQRRGGPRRQRPDGRAAGKTSTEYVARAEGLTPSGLCLAEQPRDHVAHVVDGIAVAVLVERAVELRLPAPEAADAKLASAPSPPIWPMISCDLVEREAGSDSCAYPRYRSTHRMRLGKRTDRGFDLHGREPRLGREIRDIEHFGKLAENPSKMLIADLLAERCRTR